MGNVASQDNHRLSEHRTTRPETPSHASDRSQNLKGINKYHQQFQIEPSSINQDQGGKKQSPSKVHPLLNRHRTKGAHHNNKSQSTTSTTRIMGHNNNMDSNNDNSHVEHAHHEETTAPSLQHNENNLSTQDVTMRDSGASNINLNSQPSAMNIDSGLESATSNAAVEEGDGEPQTEHHQPTPRRRSTIILTDDPEFEKLKSKREAYNITPDLNNEESISKLEDHNNSTDNEHNHNTVPFEIEWVQGGENVFITGSFTGWRKMIKLTKNSDEKFSIKLKLPIGTHRFRFIVDNELRFSDYLPTATDQMGNFVNYIEIQQPDIPMGQDDQGQEYDEKNHQQQPPQDPQLADVSAQEGRERKDSNLGLTNDDDDMGNGYSRFHEEASLKPKLNYISDIPAVFTDPSVMEQYYLTLDNNAQNNQNQAWLTPPQLPPHLESVILNQFSTTDKSNSSGALPIPNHVVLNHLATTSIKHNTLAVASVVRYKRKYATQVLYAPLQ